MSYGSKAMGNEYTVNIGAEFPNWFGDYPKFIVYVNRSDNIVTRIWHDKQEFLLYNWMQGMHIDDLRKQLAGPLDPKKAVLSIREPFKSSFDVYFEEVAGRIESLMLDISRNIPSRYDTKISLDQRPQFLTSQQRFVEYTGYEFHGPNRTNLPHLLAQMFILQGNNSMVRNLNVEMFFKDLTEQIYDQPIESTFEEIFAMMVTDEQIKLEMVGTKQAYRRTIRQIDDLAIARNVAMQAASNSALRKIISDIRAIVVIERRESKYALHGMEAAFGDLEDLGDNVSLNDINRFMNQYPMLTYGKNNEIKRAAQKIAEETPLTVKGVGSFDPEDMGLYEGFGEDYEGKQMRGGVMGFQQKIRESQQPGWMVGITDSQGQRMLRAPAMLTEQSKTSQQTGYKDEFEKQWINKTPEERERTVRENAREARRRMIIKKDRFNKMVAAGVTKQRTKLPAMDKIVVSIDKNYTFERGPVSAKVSVRGIGIEGVMSDALIKKMYQSAGGDKQALTKMMDAIVKGISSALAKTISKMIPIWQDRIRGELTDEDITGVIINKPTINITVKKDKVTASIEFKWTKSVDDSIRRTAVGELPEQKGRQELRNELAKTVSDLTKRNVVTPPTSRMEKLKRESTAKVAMGSVAQITGQEARSLIEDAATQGTVIVDSLARNLQMQPGDIVGVSIQAEEPIITVIKGGKVVTPGAIKKLIPGKPIVIQRVGIPRLEVTEPMEPVTDSFRILMRGVQQGYGGNIFEQLAKFLWQFDVPLPDYQRISSMEDLTKKVADMDKLKNRVDSEINNEVARIRTGDEENVIKDVIRRIVEGTTTIIGRQVAESEGEIATIWNRSVI